MTTTNHPPESATHQSAHNTSHVTVSHQNHVCTVTLDRADQYNTLTEAMLVRLRDEFRAIAANEAVRAVVLGATGRAFCAGHDLKEMRSRPDHAYQKHLFSLCSEMMLSMIKMPQPVIASVQGHAVAAGCQLVANADLAIAADSARFAVSGINLGLFCGTPSIPLARNVARKHALEMLILGDQIDATRAAQIGLINHAVPADDLEQFVAAWAHEITRKPPQSLALGKALYYAQVDENIQDAYTRASAMMADNMVLEDTQEGIDAFIEKRPPAWPWRTENE